MFSTQIQCVYSNISLKSDVYATFLIPLKIGSGEDPHPYINTNFQNILDHHGICHRFTCPRHPEQNI